jgi:hypothetical protein
MFAILRGANGRRHEVDFDEDPVIVDVSIGATTIQITMTAADPGDAAWRGSDRSGRQVSSPRPLSVRF